MNNKIGVLAGDYIGPEITSEGIKVLQTISEKYNLPFEIIYLEASGDAYDKYGVHLPDHTLKEAETCAALLKGPFGGPPEEINHPKWSGVEKEAILPLRKHFNLYTNLREVNVTSQYFGAVAGLLTVPPAGAVRDRPELPQVIEMIQVNVINALLHLSPIKEHIIKDVNILIVRELTSGIYFGEKKEQIINGERSYSDLEIYSESEIRRIAIKAYEYARKRQKKVTLVAKSNVLKSSVLWREVVKEIATTYPDIISDYMHVDNASMQLIINPRQFDVILTSNMFGDILSDEASVLPGSIGLLPSASLGDCHFGLYEPIHGSAPSIANKNIANPISSILCISAMLKYTFNKVNIAKEIDNAVNYVLRDGYRTQDLLVNHDDPNKLLGTDAFGNKVVDYLQNSPNN